MFVPVILNLINQTASFHLNPEVTIVLPNGIYMGSSSCRGFSINFLKPIKILLKPRKPPVARIALINAVGLCYCFLFKTYM